MKATENANVYVSDPVSIAKNIIFYFINIILKGKVGNQESS